LQDPVVVVDGLAVCRYRYSVVGALHWGSC
jgi:hypothetical protein